jgi:hypothetical protein
MRLRKLRNLAFVILLCTAFAGIQADLLAVGDPIESFCESWMDQELYDCEDCNTGEGFPPDWGASGSCDFSAIEDEEEMLQTAAAYVQDSWYACEQSCGEEYAEYVAGWYDDFANQTHPCYSAWKNPECWVTWGQVGGQAGPESDWNCGCERFFFCECEG